MWGVARLVSEMEAKGEQGSIVTLLCDSGERYLSTIFADDWLAQRGIDIGCEEDAMECFFETGTLPGAAKDSRASE